MKKKKSVESCIDMKKNFEDLDRETQAELSFWNDENVAFIKSGYEDGKRIWAIYAADGEKIAMTDDRDFAFVVAKQNDLNPKSVH